jgi:hypothetical protein
MVLGLAGCPDGGGMGGEDMAVPPGDMAMPGGPADMAPTLNGNRIVPGLSQAITVNDDGYLFYFADPNGIGAVKLDGTGMVMAIPGATWVRPTKKVVFGWVLASGTDRAGQLFAWKQGETAARMVSATALRPVGAESDMDDRTISGAAASDDGTKLLYSLNANMAGTLTDLYISNYDGTGATQVLNNISVGPGCELTTGFIGGKFIIGYCLASPTMDGGVAPSRVVAVDPASPGTLVELFNNAVNFWSPSDDGTKVFGISDAQAPLYSPITGGGATTIAGGNVRGQLGFMTNNGSAILFITDGKKLMRSAPPGAAAVELQANVERLWAISPDQSQAVVAKMVDGAVLNRTDLHLVSLTTPNQTTTLVNTVTGSIFGDAFSRDGALLYYYTAVTDDGYGTLQARTLAGGATQMVAPNVWLEYPATGNKVVFTDNYRDTNETVDVKLTDATGAAPTLIANKAHDGPMLSPDGTKLIYEFWEQRPMGVQGIYVFNIQ